jgi:tetratricopeptide (TPR) repeat protein
VDGAVRPGIEAYRQGRLDLARGDLEQAARAHPAAALPHLWLARVARDQKNDTAAARELSVAERLEPTSALVHQEIGNFHLARGRYDAARLRYVRALELDPSDTVAMGWLGCALLRLGRTEEGTRFLQRAGSGDWTRCAAQTLPPADSPRAPLSTPH